MPHRIEIPAGVLSMFRTELDSADSLPMEISRTIPRLAFKYGERIAHRMAAEDSLSTPELMRRITPPLAGLILVLVAAAWLVTWSTSELTLSRLAMVAPAETSGLLLFFGLMLVMMVAMMLPAALPMIIAVRGITRLEAGRPTKPADNVATSLFVAPYFLVWAGFGVLALAALMALGLMGPLAAPWTFIPAATLIAAGVYQVTRTKEVCLTHCQTPMSFVTLHWRSGRLGSVRMGLRHAAYCLGCCWLFMIALFVAGAMSLVWMGVLSVAIFAEKLTTRPVSVSRGIGVVLLIVGGLLAAQGFSAV